MNLNDKIYCIKICYMIPENNPTTTLFKEYTIIRVFMNNKFQIIDDDNIPHSFTNNNNEFFLNNQEFIKYSRNIKLKKLKQL